MGARTRTLEVTLADGSVEEVVAQHIRQGADGHLRLVADGQTVAEYADGEWLGVSEVV